MDINDKVRPNRITKIVRPFCRVNLLRLEDGAKSRFVFKRITHD